MACLQPSVAEGAEPADDHHVVRYCSKSRLGRDGLPTLEAFELREGESYLSAFWLEYFAGTTKHRRIDQVRQAATRVRLTLTEGGRLLELKVRDVREAGRAENCELRIHPRDDVDEPSHMGIDGWESEEQRALVAERLLAIVRDSEARGLGRATLHPGKVQ